MMKRPRRSQSKLFAATFRGHLRTTRRLIGEPPSVDCLAPVAVRQSFPLPRSQVAGVYFRYVATGFLRIHHTIGRKAVVVLTTAVDSSRGPPPTDTTGK